MYFWGTVRVLALAVIMTAAVIDDLRRYKVSNKIIAYGLAVSCVITGIEGSMEGGIDRYIFGGAAGFVIMLTAYFTGAVGAGDVKLAAVCGLLLGVFCVCEMLMWSFVLGGAGGICGILRGHCQEKQCGRFRLHCIHFSAAMAAACAALVIRKSIMGG